MDVVFQEIRIGEKLNIGGDLNGCIGRNTNGYEWSFDYGVRIEGDDKILNFASSYDLVIANTCFRDSINEI